jgi:molybdopterin molybdotransferase
VAAELISIDRARELVLAHCAPLPAESVRLDEALGRVLAGTIVASERVPAFDNSAMDGYAVRAADLARSGPGKGVRLRVVDESRAGTAAAEALAGGEAIAISTGAAIPAGADAVVRVEDTSADGDWVEVAAAVERGENVRAAGEDVEPGQTLIESGARLGPAELGVLASIGCVEVPCRRRPRLALLSTGDELIGAGEPMRPGAVRNSNAHSLGALASSVGAEVVLRASVGDDREATVEACRRGLEEAEALVACGGISVGRHDHVKAALAELGVGEEFWRVSLKPGKPVWFGTREGKLAFGLPGNPVSAFVTFLLFVRPALVALQGADAARLRTEATLTSAYEKPTDRAHAVRCRLQLGSDGWLASPAPQQGSHVMTSMVGADGLALIPAATTRVEAGERVVVELLRTGAPLAA